MTTLRKLISEIDFNNKSIQSDSSLDDLFQLFNINNYGWYEDTKLKGYLIKKHYCTDSYVGWRIYFLDGEFVAYSNQLGRKFREIFTFASLEAAKKVKDYLLSLIEEDSIKVDILTDDDLDEEIPDTYKIKFNSQILHKTALLKGERVEIVKKLYSWDDKDKYFYTVEIKKPDGSKIEIHVNELDFEYNV